MDTLFLLWLEEKKKQNKEKELKQEELQLELPEVQPFPNQPMQENAEESRIVIIEL